MGKLESEFQAKLIRDLKEMFPGSFPSDVLQSCPAYGFFVPAYIFYAFYIF